MARVLVVYVSRTGHTRKMAEYVAEGIRKEGLEVDLKPAEETSPEDFLKVDGIVAGSPTYFGLPAAELKKLFDDSVKYFGKLVGKVGGAFTSSANIAGGNETTIMAILQMMLIHGMVVQGTTLAGHYGPAAIGSPDSKVAGECRELGKRVALLIKKLAG